MYKCKLKSNFYISHAKIGRVKCENLTQEQMKFLYDNNCQYIEFSEPKKEPDLQEEEPKKTKSTIKK
jgi:hypothetical protein